MTDGDTPLSAKWKKADVIAKWAGTVLISGAIGFYGIVSEGRREDIAAKNRHAQILIQTVNHRETSAASMRAQMFKTLMEHYFRASVNSQTRKDELTRKLNILEVIGLNFQEHLHLKPLFEQLDSEVKGDYTDLREQLREAAKRIVRVQIDKIRGNGGQVVECEKGINESFTSYGIINLKLHEIHEDHVKVIVGDDGPEDAFDVCYYDMPLSDNSKMGELTYSIVLCATDISKHTAKMKIVALPKHYYSTRNQLRLDAMIGDLFLQP